MSGQKRKSAKPSKKVPTGGKPPAAAKAVQRSNKDPVWYSFTKAQTTFVESASRLSSVLHRTYGDSCSIGFFEKFLAEYAGLSQTQRDQCFLSSEILRLYDAYKLAQEARDTERQSFRGTREVASIASGLAEARAQLGGGLGSGEEKEL
jgi:hypothetical protein